MERVAEGWGGVKGQWIFLSFCLVLNLTIGICCFFFLSLHVGMKKRI